MELRNIPIDLIDRNPEQPRKAFPEAELQELADSYSLTGVIQPIRVTRKGKRFQIIAGERRWRAAGVAGHETIPAIIAGFDSDETEALAQLIENVQRSELSPMETARHIRYLTEVCGLTQKSIALAMGSKVDRSKVSHYLRLNQLPERVQALLENGDIELGHAKILCAFVDEDCMQLALEVVEKGISVRQLETLVKRRELRKKRAAASDAMQQYIERLETNLSDKTGYPVKVIYSQKKKSGRVTLDYKSLAELDGILRILGYDEDE